ncbi:hypothetical protein, partial [Actinomadura sp. RB99]|uniref:hypothetical protein n=1 Tax=Actinomadura sp. RB99 TaxID=2691577 RepID=UPI00168758D5
MTSDFDTIFVILGGVWHGVSGSYRAAQAAGYGWAWWGALFTLAVVYGVRVVIRHVRSGQLRIGTALIGTQSGRDASAASVFRSAHSVARRPSLSPFYGRPAYLRGLPAPTVVAAAWLWVEVRPL